MIIILGGVFEAVAALTENDNAIATNRITQKQYAKIKKISLDILAEPYFFMTTSKDLQRHNVYNFTEEYGKTSPFATEMDSSHILASPARRFTQLRQSLGIYIYYKRNINFSHILLFQEGSFVVRRKG